MHSQMHVQSPQTKDIQELCDEYYIETRHIEKLNELMKDRQEPHELTDLWINKKDGMGDPMKGVAWRWTHIPEDSL